MQMTFDSVLRKKKRGDLPAFQSGEKIRRKGRKNTKIHGWRSEKKGEENFTKQSF